MHSVDNHLTSHHVLMALARVNIQVSHRDLPSYLSLHLNEVFDLNAVPGCADGNRGC